MKLVIFAVLLSAGVAGADATKVIPTHKGKCTITVPASWTGTTSSARSPDKKLQITVSDPDQTFDELKTNVKTVYTDDKVTKSTATEFEMEGTSPINSKPNVYRGIPRPGGVCIAEITYDGASADDARKIVRTLAVK
jgi:hypothetical protein